MDFKKSNIHIFLFFLVFAFSLSLKSAGSEENKWKLMGMTKDKNFLVYYDPSSVNYITETYVRLTLKKDRSEEGIEQFKKDFYDTLKEAEDKSGERIKGDPEPLLNILLKREIKEYIVDIDCTGNEIRVPPAKMSAFNFVVVNEIEPGTAVEKIRDEVCKKKDP
ncbi:MAG: hypothetical protein HY754_13020 [Nitrospirae bacterium]|nr:hypothetical protein [Nitrospirota bacterium]